MLDPKRKGEISIAILRYHFKKKGVRIFPGELKREMGNIAKETGVPINELVEFLEEEVRRFVDESFTKLKK